MAESQRHQSSYCRQIDQSTERDFFNHFLDERGKDPERLRRINQQAELLELRDGEIVLDVRCGIGNETRFFAGEVGEPGTVTQ
jgi:cyclopropane fatty-acyl-phospholipid synthase-like methyltransferase